MTSRTTVATVGVFPLRRARYAEMSKGTSYGLALLWLYSSPKSFQLAAVVRCVLYWLGCGKPRPVAARNSVGLKVSRCAVSLGAISISLVALRIRTLLSVETERRLSEQVRASEVLGQGRWLRRGGQR